MTMAMVYHLAALDHLRTFPKMGGYADEHTYFNNNSDPRNGNLTFDECGIYILSA